MDVPSSIRVKGQCVNRSKMSFHTSNFFLKNLNKNKNKNKYEK
jgi:hypothetical protein